MSNSISANDNWVAVTIDNVITATITTKMQNTIDTYYYQLLIITFACMAMITIVCWECEQVPDCWAKHKRYPTWSSCWRHCGCHSRCFGKCHMAVAITSLRMARGSDLIANQGSRRT